MSLVLDASTALKWVLNEEGSDRAEALIGDEPLIAPDLVMLECANVLALRVKRGLWTPEKAIRAMSVLDAMPLRRLPSHPHVFAAQRLASELRQTAYDCLYLALALHEDAVMVTADRRFAEAVQREPAYASSIRLL